MRRRKHIAKPATAAQIRGMLRITDAHLRAAETAIRAALFDKKNHE